MDKNDIYQILDHMNARYNEMKCEELCESVTNYQMKNLIWLLWNYFQAETGNLPPSRDQ